MPLIAARRNYAILPARVVLLIGRERGLWVMPKIRNLALSKGDRRPQRLTLGSDLVMPGYGNGDGGGGSKKWPLC